MNNPWRSSNLEHRLWRIMGLPLLVAGVAACYSADAADGFATVNGNTVGGAGGPIVTVTTFADLAFYATNASPFIIQVSGPIDLGSASFKIQSNKTIVGTGAAPGLAGELDINGQSNIIVHNLFISNDNGGGTGDGVRIRGGSHHIWVDHCTLTDCDDGEVDITGASDYVTVSWCKFNYTRNNLHNFVNLIGADDSDIGDRGTLHVTFHHDWWSTLCIERMPRVRFGLVHVYNNYYNCATNNYCLRAALESVNLLENNYYDNVSQPWQYFTVGGQIPGLIRALNNVFVNTLVPAGGNDPAFTPPYPYALDPGADVKSIVMAGAGAHSTQWFTVDAGGGTSAGGDFSLTGTIGQPDAGRLSGGDFVLRGGFWGLAALVQTPGAPTLSIGPAGPGQALISWSSDDLSWSLQETAGLSPATWTNSPSGTNNPAIVPATAPARFFRLFKP
jgi:pectate lyase